MKKVIIKGIGEHCRRCHKPMQRRKHATTPTNPKQKYYFTEWDVCLNCHHIQHYEKFKTQIPKGQNLFEALMDADLGRE